VVFDPISRHLSRFDTFVSPAGTVSFTQILYAQIPAGAGVPTDQFSVARLSESSPVDGLVFRSKLTGHYRFFTPTAANNVLSEESSVAVGQLPVRSAMDTTLAFGRFADKPAGEPGGTTRDDAMFFDSNGTYLRVDARHDSGLVRVNAPRATYWWAYTRVTPTNHVGWPKIRRDRWAVLKCAWADVVPPGNRYAGPLPQEGYVNRPGAPRVVALTKAQYIDPLFQSDTFIRNVLTKQGSGKKNNFDYILENTYGGMSMEDMEFHGWFQMDTPIGPLLDANGNPDRYRAIQACERAATSYGVDLSGYQGILGLWNFRSFAGSLGTTGNAPLPDPAGRMWFGMDATNVFWDITGVAHETLHPYGLNHANTLYPNTNASYPAGFCSGTTEYCDHFDPMGAGQFFTPNLSTYHLPQYNPDVPAKFLPAAVLDHPELSAPNRHRLGMLPAQRVLEVRRDAGGRRTVTATLAPTNRPETSGYLLLKLVDPQDPSGYYAVEFRQKSGWDRNIPEEGVIVRSIKSNDKKSYLIANPKYRNPGGNEPYHVQYFTAGEAVTVPGYTLRIEAIHPGPANLALPGSTAAVAIDVL
jgi:hypothetical protein